MIPRSDNGGESWEPVGNEFVYDGVPGTHQWYDGTPHPWEFKRVWHLEPSADDPDVVLAGVEDAALFRSADGGKSWQELAGLIRVILPTHLRTLARVESEIALDVSGPVTQRSVLYALEARYPVLRGTIRDHVTHERRPFVRYFACQRDLSHESPDLRLPDSVVTGVEPFLVIGAVAGG